MKVPFIGNGAYCYANSTSMLLSSIGENISPGLIEVLCGVGIGINSKRSTKISFNNLALKPDLGITFALDTLGYSYTSKFSEEGSPPPIDELKDILVKSSVLAGPLTMGYLTYNPSHKSLMEADHFLIIIDYTKNGFRVHDPEGYPNALISIEDLVNAWKAENVDYKKGIYRYLTDVKVNRRPSAEEIVSRAITEFKKIYTNSSEIAKDRNYKVGIQAINSYIGGFKDRELSSGEKSSFLYFSLPLSAKRALDYSNFYASNKLHELADIKVQLSESYGSLQTYVMQNNKEKIIENLQTLGVLEDAYEKLIFSTKL